MARPRALRHGLFVLLAALSFISDARRADGLKAESPSPGTRTTGQVEVAAVGADSLNRTTTPFWAVSHLSNGPSIVKVSFNWAASSVLEQRDARFDVDQRGLGGYTLFGNGSAPALGTYALNSDTATGLIYDGLNTFHGVTKDGKTGGNCGFIATSPANDLNDFRKLEFRFTGGAFSSKVFTFDCDTDGGLGYSARDMAGLHVTVVLVDGTTLQGELLPDPAHAMRSVLVL